MVGAYLKVWPTCAATPDHSAICQSKGHGLPKISGAEVYFARGKHGEQMIQFTVADNMDSEVAPNVSHSY